MSTEERIVAVIPARYGSERLPGKPLADIAGKPMIQHVVERVRKASLVQEVIVATDDERIAAAVRSFGGRAVMTDPALRSGTDRIAMVARELADAGIVVNVQGDEPLIHPGMVDEAVRPLLGDSGLNVATLVHRITDPADLENPAVVKVVLDHHLNCLYFSRSLIPFARDIPVGERLLRAPYWKHVGLYVFRRAFLLRFASLPQTSLERAEKLEQLRILEHGERIRASVTEHESQPVDTPGDLERVRAQARESHG
jgi:3-deoxy-manno-octulosonate cytidylyltransferase (CMP-KDO synthetase)